MANKSEGELQVLDIEREQVWLTRLLRDLQECQFYGHIEVVYEQGRIVRVIKNQTILPITRGR